MDLIVVTHAGDITDKNPCPYEIYILLCWNIKNTASSISKLPSDILFHSRNENDCEHYIDCKPFLQSQVQDRFFRVTDSWKFTLALI